VDRAQIPLVQQLVDQRMARHALSKVAHVSSVALRGGCQ
jgi:hypothetical protein